MNKLNLISLIVRTDSIQQYQLGSLMARCNEHTINFKLKNKCITFPGLLALTGSHTIKINPDLIDSQY